MSQIPPLSIQAFPAWARLNDVDFTNIQVKETEGRGFGLVATRDLKEKESGDPTGNEGDDGNGLTARTGARTPNTTRLMRIPHELVLSADTLEEYAKIDKNFRELLQATDHRTARENIMLYLVVHLLQHSRDHATSRVVPTAWTEYIKFLTREVPLPTMWTELERGLLAGTSLEVAVKAKLSRLSTEFDELCEKASELPFWTGLFGENGAATIDHWVLADAWYRSRCLELPRDGTAMVPGLDMVNHSGTPTAFYQQDDKDDILLLLRPTPGVACGEEITISYGQAKSPAEMLFSYGFVDPDSAFQQLLLPLDVMQDDPLGRAKLHIMKGAPSVKLSRTDGRLEWHSPFAYLVVLNEEDGLEFRVLQDTDGGRQLKLFWQDEDVTERTDEFEALIHGHPLRPVFQLRVVSVLHHEVGRQLERLDQSKVPHEAQEAKGLREECVVAAEALKAVETSLLQSAAEVLNDEMLHLFADDHVVAYLGSKETSENGKAQQTTANDAEEFS